MDYSEAYRTLKNYLKGFENLTQILRGLEEIKKPTDRGSKFSIPFCISFSP